MRTARGLIAATHAMPTAAVTAFCTATAISAGLAGSRVVLLALAVLAGQASVGWTNDWADARRDLVAARRDKPIPRGDVAESTVAWAAGAAATACVLLSLSLGARPGAVHLVAVAWAWAYNVVWKFGPASPLPYAVAFGLVPPVLVAQALPGSPAPRWSVVAATATLGVAAHFANTVDDTAADAATGVTGLPQRIGPRAATVVSGVLVAIGALVLLVGNANPLTLVAAIVAVAVAAVSGWLVLAAGRTGPAFRLVVGAVAVLVVAFVVTGGGHLTASR